MSLCGITVSFNGTAEQIYFRLPAVLEVYAEYDNTTTTNNITSTRPSIRAEPVPLAKAKAKQSDDEVRGLNDSQQSGFSPYTLVLGIEQQQQEGEEKEEESQYLRSVPGKATQDPFKGLGIGERLQKCKKGELPFIGYQ